MTDIAASWQMWITLAAVTAAIVAYSLDRFSLELVSGFVLGFFLIFFHFFPIEGPEGQNPLDAIGLFEGFASPALFAILGLLIVGQGMYQSGALDYPTRVLISAHAKYRQFAVVGVFVFVMLVSAFLNNTPVVVMFVPIMAAMAAQAGIAPSRLMMPLSFMSILGGMTTTIGSSTNLLAVEAYATLTGREIGFFELMPLGLVLAFVGSIYMAFATRTFLPDRFGEAARRPDGRQFVAQLTLDRGNPLIGEKSVAGLFPTLKNLTVRLVQRRDEIILPPYDDLTLRLHDKIVVSATRDSLTKLLKSKSEILRGFMSEVELPETGAGELTMVEAVVAPGSRIIGRSITQIRFRFQTNCVILGIQRRSRMIRTDLTSIRLEAGDVLLILGDRADVRRLSQDRDILMLEQSMTQLPDPDHARYAGLIFLGIVTTVAMGIIPISIAAIMGAALMVSSGCLNVRQASRAIDRRVYLLVGVAFAMGAAMEETGAAAYLSTFLVPLANGPGGVTLLMSAFFLLSAALTNVLSNNATAVLFTPIAVSAASMAGIDPFVLVLTIIYGANCSFATPVAYQTNLLVMAPGHYQFRDFIVIGVPLIVLLWVSFTLVAPIYFSSLGLL